MEINLLHFLPPKPPLPSIPVHGNPLPVRLHTRTFKPRRGLSLRLNSTEGDDTAPPPPSPTITPSDTVATRLRRGSRRRRRERGEEPLKAERAAEPEAPKKWEDMSLREKAMELYVGEKGLLFWLNKFAYASIFIVIGGWILFRFVGPSLNLYQLDTPPLSPTSIFKG